MATEATGGTQGTLSPWAGDYVTDMLGKAWGLSELPFQSYGGQLTAGPSNLQTQAFQGLGNLTLPQNLATAGQQAQQTFGAAQQYMPTVGTVQSYMNPYLESVLEPQRRAAEEAATKARMETQGRLAQAGAYGGSRQAILEAEGQKNLQTLLSDITGKGYAGAWDNALKQRLGEMDTGIRGLGAQTAATQALSNIGGQQAQYGLQNLQEMLKAGQTQRDITQQGLTADYNQYLRQFDYPQKMLEFQRNMIQGIPGVASSAYYSQAPSGIQSAAGGASVLIELLNAILGNK